MRAATVCFLHRHGKILLQERAPGRLWAGRLNGPGGKIDQGETPEAAVIREVAEETGLRLANPIPHGTLDLLFGEAEPSFLRVFVFSCATFDGRPRGGREGALRWFSIARLPFDRLWPDMRYWLPAVLDGGSVSGECRFDAAGERLIACSLQIGIAPPGDASPAHAVEADSKVTTGRSSRHTDWDGHRTGEREC